jgi:transcriptional regulator with XRE-family HTH domain
MTAKPKITPAKSHSARPEKPEGSPRAIRIGARLRHARLTKGLNLKAVAAGIDCSESFISKLENDKVQPSLAILHKLVAFLGINVTSLFNENDPNEGPLFVMQAGTRPVIRTSLRHQTDGVALERLVPYSRTSLLQANIHELAPGGSGHGLIAHAGEELGYVLEGEIDLTVGDTTHRVKAGDAFFFSSEHAHGYVNAGKAIARILWVNTPPTF